LPAASHLESHAHVENLWMARAKPVEKLTTKKYLWPDRGLDPTSGGMWTPPSRGASLDHSGVERRIERSTCCTRIPDKRDSSLL
jgi:hypothetical protein